MNKFITIENIIAKIDNDFNLDNTDWIPRIAAWSTDAISQLKVLRTELKETKVAVINNIAKLSCKIDNSYIKIYDDNGCEVKEIDEAKCVRCGSDSPSTGERNDNITSLGDSGTREVINTDYNGPEHYRSVSIHNNTTIETNKHNVYEEYKLTPRREYDKYYIVIDSNTIELNFNTKYITIITKGIKTQYSEYYKTEIPVIPNNGILIEAIGFYCMYKMLCRGYKHPVFNLNASQYGTNPYYIWMQLKEKAKISVTLDEQGDSIDNIDGWQSYFFNYTFPKR